MESTGIELAGRHHGQGRQETEWAIVEAWKLGARFDAWSEHFKMAVWEKAFEQPGIIPEFYHRERKPNEILPGTIFDPA
jgi:hypothetical protein